MHIKYQGLGKYIPEGALPIISTWLDSAPIQLKVSKPRNSKLGDYAPASTKNPVHRISVNGDLNPYSFLVTLVHEFAHFTAYQRSKWDIKPHGPEWQYEYARLMRPFIERRIFPDDVTVALEHHLLRAPASSCTDPVLIKILHGYDDGPPKTRVEDIPFNTFFKLGKKTFLKGRKLRKRYQCRCMEDNREYYVDALAEVLPSPAMST